MLPDEFVAESAGHHTWESVTPYVATGHPHRDRAAFLAKRFVKDTAQAWASLPAIAAVEFTPLDSRGTPAAAFERRRFKDQMHGVPVPATAFVRVTFAEPVAGPVVIGALTHFGLGLFRPADE